VEAFGRSLTEGVRQALEIRQEDGELQDACGRVVSTVSYNARLWEPGGKREEIVIR
jgi:hypothetical protein